MRQLVAAIVEFLRSWWCVDRIRVSPREGRLLRLRPGSIVRLAGTMWEIGSRSAAESCRGPLVKYDCHAGDATAELWIAVSSRVPAAGTNLDATVEFPSQLDKGDVLLRVFPDPTLATAAKVAERHIVLHVDELEVW